MNTRSVRFRLTTLYSSTLIIALLIILSGFYFITRRELYSHTDMTLSSHTQRITSILSKQNYIMNPQLSTQLLSELFEESPGMYVIITDQDGTVISSSQNIPNDSQIAKDLIGSLPATNTTVFRDHAVGTMKMRFLLLPVTISPAVREVVMVGHPIDVIQQSLTSINSILVAVFFLFSVPTVVGGYLIAGKGLKPVADVASEMEHISSENLTHRIRNPNTRDEIERLVVTFNSLLDRLEEAFSREQQFIGDMAHELKTPLATLKTSIEVAKTKKRSVNDYDVLLRDTLIDINRLSDTINSLLELARSKSDISDSLHESTNISEVLSEITEIGQKIGAKKGITLTGSIARNITVSGKRDKLFRAMLNLVDNAIKYNRKSGSVSITLKAKERHAVVTIADTGIGITSDDLPHVFTRFFRGSGTGKRKGSGLGLAITQAIVIASGGTIEVKSSKNGTIFTVQLLLAAV